MQKTIVIALAALTTTGCSQLLYPGAYAPARSRMVAPRPLPPPVPIGRWDSVMRLPPGSIVDVLSMNGEAFAGPIAGVDGFAVRVVMRGVEEQIPRADVLRVDLLDLPGSEAGAVAKQAGLGAVVGVGAAALIAGVIGGPAWPPPGALVRGGAAIGGVAGGQAALAARQARLIYLAEHQGSMPYSSGRPDLPIEREAWARVARSYSAKEWLAIVNLSPGEMVRVVRSNGSWHQGALLGAGDAAVWLDMQGAELRITRDSILRVDVLEIPEPSPAPRTMGRLPSKPALAIAAGIADMAAPAGSFVAGRAAPLVRLGAPTLPIGGAQAQILRFQAPSSRAQPSPIGTPSPAAAIVVAPAARPMRGTICQAPAVSVSR
jgi:hypothetical protein